MQMTKQEYRKRRNARVVKKFRKLTRQDKLDIIEAYSEGLESAMSIAVRYDKTRQGIWKLLKKAGIDTAKKGIAVSCTTCKAIIHKPKSQLRNRKNHFCNMACYQSYLNAGASHLTSIENRKGSRRARAIVKQHFDLQPGHIVHHEDKFSLNNQLWNLRVFANQGDHIRYHHQVRDLEHNDSSTIIVEPIWNGAELNQ